MKRTDDETALRSVSSRSMGYCRDRRLATIVGSVLLAYWGTLGYGVVGLPAVIGLELTLFRRALGVAMLTFVPGVLIYASIGSGSRSSGVFLSYVVGLSLVALSLLGVVVSVAYRPLGIEAPLSLYPLSITLTIAVLLTLSVVILTNRPAPPLAFSPGMDGRHRRITLLLLALPAFAILAAHLLNRYDLTVQMYVLLLVVAGAAVLVVRSVPTDLYPISVYTLGLSVLLHRNLVTDFVIGSDIQETYFVAELIAQAGYWTPALGDGSTLAALPMVTVVPAIYTVIADVPLALVYKLVYSFVFALTPVTMFYAFRQLFSDREALLGSLFFLFYFVTFNGVPGKQRIAELFVALIVLVVVQRGWKNRRAAAMIALLGIGAILSHYTVSYVFGSSAVAAWLILSAYDYSTDDRSPRFAEGVYALGSLCVATAWYSLASTRLFETLSGLPVLLLEQIRSVLTGQLLHRTGAQEAQMRTSATDLVNFSLHAALVVLMATGLAYLVYTIVRRERSYGRAAYAALATPLFGFLGASFFLSGNLGVDRTYQIVLVFLAPLMPVGYRVVQRITSGWTGVELREWTSLSVVLAVLLLFNTGVLYNATGAPVSSDITLDADAHSQAYSNAEVVGGRWLVEHTAENTTVYTDLYTNELFRSIAPAGYTETNVTLFKYDWIPYLRFGSGYVYLRNNSVRETITDRSTEFQYVSESERLFLNRRAHKIYDNRDATIFRYTSSKLVVYDPDSNASDTNTSNERSERDDSPTRIGHPKDDVR
jgi:uncharacterized membrane protein